MQFFSFLGNIWDMERYILEKLVKWKNGKNRKPLIIKGARQVGKTYILKEFGEKHFPNYLYANFEEDEQLEKIFQKDLKPRRILDELAFHLDKPLDTAKDLIIFDEIQQCPRALTSLKYFNEEYPGLALCSAGSLLGLQLGRGSFPVGKVDFLEMFPLCFEEFLLANGETKAYDYVVNCRLDSEIPEIVHSKLWEWLKVFFITGGLPEAVKEFRERRDGGGNLYDALTAVRDKQKYLIWGYEADMAKHSGKENSMHINRLWRNIPAQLARQQDGSSAKFKFKDVVPGIKGYSRLSSVIDWLGTAGLVIKVPIVETGQLPFSAFTQESVFKLYIFDAGILGALSRLSPSKILEYDYGSYKGYFAENFIAQEFLCSGRNGFVGWREGGAEVEFLQEIDGNIIPVEIKSGWVTRSKSLNMFAQKYIPNYRVIMSARNLNIDAKRNVHRYPLYLAYRFPLAL